ncbi:MAG: non-heme iron oxygenase ferredoxin subunit [Candidatus Micrarchaeota archaeon]|nr:non-heme iron oxygenase ferredoxin subunit [Candidatus Micrarchaeota archaeon]
MIKIAKLSEIPMNGCKNFEISGKKIAIYNVSGRIYAADSECSHMKGPLCKGRILSQDGNQYVQCPWHGATFNLETGEAMSGPTRKPIRVYKIKIEKDEIFVELTD